MILGFFYSLLRADMCRTFVVSKGCSRDLRPLGQGKQLTKSLRKGGVLKTMKAVVKKSATVANVWVVMNRSRRMFARQLKASQNLVTKIACIQEVANGVYNDPKRIWFDVLTEAKRLTNLIDFNAYCQSLSLNPANVAQHIIFEGSGIVNRIMRHGVQEVMGERIRMFRNPLFDESKVIDEPMPEAEMSGEKVQITYEIPTNIETVQEE